MIPRVGALQKSLSILFLLVLLLAGGKKKSCVSYSQKMHFILALPKHFLCCIGLHIGVYICVCVCVIQVYRYIIYIFSILVLLISNVKNDNRDWCPCFSVVTETGPQNHRESVMWNKGNKLNCNCNGLLFLNLYPTTFQPSTFWGAEEPLLP